MTCVLEVYDICKQRGTSCVMVHTNLGYIHYHDTRVWHYTGPTDWRGPPVTYQTEDTEVREFLAWQEENDDQK